MIIRIFAASFKNEVKMKYKKTEGNFYANKVRLFQNEYNGISLEEFCKAERVSYEKMCHCLGRQVSYRKPTYKKPKPFLENAPEAQGEVLPVMELKPLVIDFPKEVSQDESKEVSPESRPTSVAVETKQKTLSGISIRIGGKIDLGIKTCDVSTLVSLIKEMEVSLC
jgi:hypothetical protein